MHYPFWDEMSDNFTFLEGIMSFEVSWKLKFISRLCTNLLGNRWTVLIS